MRGVRSERATTARGVRAGGWLLGLLCLLVVFLAVTGSATAAGTQALGEENDTEPPTWENATKAGPEEIELIFTDNSTIDRKTIAATDFALSSGSVANVSVESTDGGLSVLLLLEDRLNVNNVTVRFSEAGGIADMEGNELTNGTKTVTGMDTSVPDFRSFDLTRVNDSTVDIRVAASEPLSGLRVAVTGPTNDRLTMADFTAVDDANTTFEARYTVPEFGAYSFVWERAIDRYDNQRVMSRMRQFRYEDSAPEIVFDGPTRTTVDTSVNFSAAETVDEDGIDSYRWRIDGGTVLSGPSIRVAFAAAGRHDITLAVTDSKGYTAVETREIQVEQSADSPVSVTVHNGTHANATVEGAGLVQQVRAEKGTLVGTDNVTLERLSAAFPANTSVSLRFRASDSRPGSLEGSSFGLFEIDHDQPANRVSIRFSVDRESLNRTGVAPGAVALYRNADGWTPLSTSVVSRLDDRVVYQATASGLSQFAVGTAPEPSGPTVAETGEPTAESPTGTESPATGSTATTDPVARSDITITNVTVNETAPSVGETVVINVTATNRGAADGTYPFSVRLNGTSVATHELSVPAGATVTRSYEQNLTTEGELSVAGTPVTNVTEPSGGSLLPASVAGLLSGLPNPLALWPGGLVGTVLGAVVGLVVVVYSILKALAIYLGY
ncbi:PKD domain-containing protein [Haloarcula salinisoli]|uniref:PGF-pre-PGF domain-containing protein n=1 Tax=Haloarcula salinisoli TaxID=2487746 RepID=A0A8J7YH55_9EURY|nr:PKD domain-containing protein [Halomicroarcula salinisoli]MBX0285580.1 PGF-pre-PGF domain-containing protein [Halomicroarcula salinisoli]MBX0302934.1 PGF-pre-PGF domain-containing protein [Halomicroarcula salinisoli]